MKKILASILTIVLVMTLITGCGKKNEDVSVENSTSSQQPKDAAKKETSKEEVKKDNNDVSKEKVEENKGNETKKETDADNKESSTSANSSNKESTSNKVSSSDNSSNNDGSVSDKVDGTPPKEQVPTEKYVTLSITCNTILSNMDKVVEGKKDIIPSNGVILGERKVKFEEGENVFDVLKRETRSNRIHMDFMNSPVYQSVYVKGIANIYEFDVGSLSGWMYSVNGVFPNYGASKYVLKDGDKIEWKYTCDLGKDLGHGM